MKAIKLTNQDIEVLDLLKNDLINIKEKSKTNLIIFLTGVWSCIVDYMYSLKDFSLSNIKSRGLSTIIEERASRFFKIETSQKKAKKSTKKKIKFGKRVLKLVVFPVYIIAIIVDMVKNKEKNDKKNVNYINKS